MRRKHIVFGLAFLAILAFTGFVAWNGSGWDQTSVTRVVPGENGETLVITDNGHPGFFPFFPFIFFIPALWILMIGGVFAVLGRGRWGGGPPCGPEPQSRNAWLEDWHRRQHDGASPPKADTSSTSLSG